MKITRVHIAVFVAIAALVWWGVLAVEGEPIRGRDFAPFGIVVSVLAALALALEKNLWHRGWLQGWFVGRPDVRGTWRVTLQSDWVDPKTGNNIEPIIGYFGVKQTLSTLQMHLMTPQSESWFVAHSISHSPSDHGFQIVAVYTNKPNLHLRRGVSDMHLGALILDTHGDVEHRPSGLTGEYWTDRKTSGTITSDDHIATVCTRYDDAKAAFIAHAAQA